MALSHGKILLGRFVLVFLLATQVFFFACSGIFFSVLMGHWTLEGILLSLLIFSIFLLSLIGFASFFFTWLIGKRHYYSYIWFGYTFVLIVNISVVVA